MSIWRINCKPGSRLVSHKESFNKWLEKGFIGIKWSKEENSLEGLNEGISNIETIRSHIYTNLKKKTLKQGLLILMLISYFIE
jgi:hypothetical protein